MNNDNFKYFMIISIATFFVLIFIIVVIVYETKSDKVFERVCEKLLPGDKVIAEDEYGLYKKYRYLGLSFSLILTLISLGSMWMMPKVPVNGQYTGFT